MWDQENSRTGSVDDGQKYMTMNQKIILITGSTGPPLLHRDGSKPCHYAEDILQSGTSLPRTF